MTVVSAMLTPTPDQKRRRARTGRLPLRGRPAQTWRLTTTATHHLRTSNWYSRWTHFHSHRSARGTPLDPGPVEPAYPPTWSVLGIRGVGRNVGEFPVFSSSRL